MISIKTLALATAVSAGIAFAMPVASQAMPQSSPVKIDTVKNSNIVEVKHRKRGKRWARYCRRNWDDPRCYRGRRHARYYRHRYRYYEPYYEPYYGYYEPYYHRPRFYGPGIGFHFNID